MNKRDYISKKQINSLEPFTNFHEKKIRIRKVTPKSQKQESRSECGAHWTAGEFECKDFKFYDSCNKDYIAKKV